jgi:hypothetical protein
VRLPLWDWYTERADSPRRSNRSVNLFYMSCTITLKAPANATAGRGFDSGMEKFGGVPHPIAAVKQRRLQRAGRFIQN